MKRYTLENKPDFKDGEVVAVDTSVLGISLGILPGKIVGKAVSNVIDWWMVEFNAYHFPSYPYKVVSIMHLAFLQKE
jgi:hypothetical protein